MWNIGQNIDVTVTLSLFIGREQMKLSKLQGISIMDDTFWCSGVDRQIIDEQKDQVVIHWEVATSTPISPHYTHINCNARIAQKKGGGRNKVKYLIHSLV